MFNTLIAIVLAVVIFFSGTATTVFAAQESLPNQALYQVKIWSEDALLSLAGSPQARMEHNLDFSDRRITEMIGLVSTGSPIPEKVEIRLQNELDRALELAAGMDDPQMLQQLEQVRMRAEIQLQKTSLLISGDQGSTEPFLIQAHARIQEQVELAALGQVDPQGFRMQVQKRLRYHGGSGEQTPMPGHGTQTPASTLVPTGNGYGPGHEGTFSTRTPGQYGPGPNSPNSTPQPGGSSGHGP